MRTRASFAPIGPGRSALSRDSRSDFWPFLLVGLLIAGWWVSVVVSKTPYFPTPWAVVLGIVELARNGTLVQHVSASLMRVTYGYLAAVAIAIPLGVLMGWFGRVYRAVNPLIQLLRPISPIAWIPLAILWFGVGNLSPMFLIFLSSFFPMVTGTAAGVHTIEKQYIRAAENFGIRGVRLLRQVVLPAALPQVIVGMRLGLGIAWLVVVAAEMVAINSGLGYLIIDSRNAGNRYDLVVAGMVLIGVIGFLLDIAMRSLEGLDEVRWRYVR
ncbi:MAG: ABC transporter permease [Gemmatimonadetes bacterium]|nr:ABC transporter permease [Gemmatimonadota bacterium]